MLSIDTSDVLDYTKQNDNTLPAAVAFAYNAGTKVLTFTDNTVYAAGDSRVALNIEVYDKFGGKKQATLGVPGDPAVNAKAIDLDANDADGKPLNVSEGVSIIVTLVSAKGKVKNGSVHDVVTLKAAGSVVMDK